MTEYNQIRLKGKLSVLSDQKDPSTQSLRDGQVLRAITGDTRSSLDILGTDDSDLECSRVVDHLRSGLVFNVNTISVVKALIIPQTFDTAGWLDQRVWRKVGLMDFLSGLTDEGVRLILGANQSLIEGTKLATPQALSTRFRRAAQVVRVGIKVNPEAVRRGSDMFLSGLTDLPEVTLDLVLSNGGRLPREVNPTFRKLLEGALDGRTR